MGVQTWPPRAGVGRWLGLGAAWGSRGVVGERRKVGEESVVRLVGEVVV